MLRQYFSKDLTECNISIQKHIKPILEGHTWMTKAVGLSESQEGGAVNSLYVVGFVM